MNITAAQVKELREKTGCPMMDCKQALMETKGDFEEAITYLRKRGHEGAAKRKDRATAEGFMAAAVNPRGTRAAAVEVLCETDFVGRNKEFQNSAKVLADALLASGSPETDAAGVLELKSQDGKRAGDTFEHIRNLLKENIKVGRVCLIDSGDSGLADAYVHFNGKVGAVVAIRLSDPSLAAKPGVKDLLRDICMQISFSAPLAIDRTGINPALIEEEKAVIAELDEVKEKPEKVRPKIIEGKLSKFFKDFALLEQEYVKDKKLNVGQLVKQVAKDAGGTIEVAAFKRLEIGKE